MKTLIGLTPLSRAVLRRAGQPLGTVVRTLDAIHVASVAMPTPRTDAANTQA
jgi:hypothetical protein